MDRNWWKPCEKCRRQIANNWIGRHIESGCKSGISSHPRKYFGEDGKEQIKPTRPYFQFEDTEAKEATNEK